MLKRRLLRTACAMSLLAFAAAAQEPAAAPDVPESTDTLLPEELGAVVVTTRRREEILQQVPLAVTALDGAELNSRGAEDLSALGAAVPNLTIYPARAFSNAVTAYIRGVGQSEPAWGVEPGVGIYVDDVYLARPQAALLDILDVERIEVLRGPQGTLYGRNTIGGAIKYITRAVDTDFSGNVGILAGDYGRREFKGAVNLPMGDELGARVSFGSFDRDGFGKNLITGEDVSAKDTTVARVTTRWAPHEQLEMRLAYDIYRDDSGALGAKRLAINPFDPNATPPNSNNYDVQSGMPNLDKSEAVGWSATIDWAINERMQLKSITAHRHGDFNANVDLDTLPQALNDVFRHFSDQQSSQEFQWQWNTDRAHAVTGLYLFDADAAGNVKTSTRGTFMVSTGVVKTESAALFSDLVWDFDNRMSLELGLRYTRERKTGTVFNQGYTDATFTEPNGRVLADFTDSTVFHSPSPLINLSYAPSEALMLYAQVSRGFKSGGYNIRANTLFVPESGLPFQDETVTAYEVGAKSGWLDDHLTLNASAFHYDYHDIQLSVSTSYDSNGDGKNDSFFGDFKNAGRGTINGAELEFSARTGEYLRWLGHAGYLDTGYEEFISKGVNVADKQRFTNAPRWTSGVSAIAEIPLKSAGILVARVDGNYQSKVYPTTDLSEFIAQDGYTLWNASLTWHSPSKRWQAALVGLNLTDKAYRITGSDNVPLLGLRTAYYGPPKTVSVSATYFF